MTVTELRIGLERIEAEGYGGRTVTLLGYDGVMQREDEVELCDITVLKGSQTVQLT